MTWWQQPVDIKPTQIVRDHALGVVRWVIENLDWKASLATLDVLSHAMVRCAPIQTRHFKKADQDRYIADWRPERRKALEIIGSVLQKHPHVLVQYSVRKDLLSDLVHEEDSEFAQEVRDVLSKLNETFELRLTTVVNSPGGWDYDDQSREEIRQENWFERGRERWRNRVQKLVVDMLEKYPDPADAAWMLLCHANTSLEAGLNPHHGELFQSIADKSAP